MRLRLKLAAAAAAASVAAAAAVMFLNPVAAQGHGAMLIPGSRTYLCYVDGHVSTGEIKPFNSACQNAPGSTRPATTGR